jgi:hypothetical protein
VWDWPAPVPVAEELDAYRDIAVQARLDAEARRLALFVIDLEPGREGVTATDVLAFRRADQATLPARVRAVMRAAFDEPLRAGAPMEPLTPLRARAR